MTACDTTPQVDAFTTDHLLRLMTTAPNAFWRFDVDVSLQAAAKMARFANLAGVTGTFYVMPRGEFYNPFCRDSMRAVDEILDLGHRVGIHCDYRGDDVHVEVAVLRDKAMMNVAGYIGRLSPKLVSFHMPPKGLLWRDFSGFDSAYASKWDGRYVSDSRREWDDAKDARVTDDMQIALHAEHWFPCG